jgi:hypothetical protein
MASSGRQRSYQALPYINAPRVAALDTDKDTVLVWSDVYKSVVRVPSDGFSGGPALQEFAYTVGGYEAVATWFPYSGESLSDPPIGEFFPGAYGTAAFTFAPTIVGATRVSTAYLSFLCTKTPTFAGVTLKARLLANPAVPGAGNLPSTWGAGTFTTSVSFSNQFTEGADSLAARGPGFIDVAPQINEILSETAWVSGNNIVFFFETLTLEAGRSLWIGQNANGPAAAPRLFIGL